MVMNRLIISFESENYIQCHFTTLLIYLIGIVKYKKDKFTWLKRVMCMELNERVPRNMHKFSLLMNCKVMKIKLCKIEIVLSHTS